MNKKSRKFSLKNLFRKSESYAITKKQKKFLIQDEIVKDRLMNENTPFNVREAYKTLRTNLIFSLPTTGCKILSVTSAHASEGKSTNCMNIAISFSEMNAKVLVIDCDLRRPNAGKLLDIPNNPGLSNYLVGLCSADDIVTKTAFENLYCIPAGNIPPNPIELLSSDNMAKLLKNLEKEYDYIFLDTPPVNLVIDTAVIANYVHGVVVVVLQNSTDKENLSYALNQLKFVDAKVLGFVLNGAGLGSKGQYKANKSTNYRNYFSEI